METSKTQMMKKIYNNFYNLKEKNCYSNSKYKNNTFYFSIL